MKTTCNAVKYHYSANDSWLQSIWDDSNNRLNGNKLRTYRLFKFGACTEPYVKQHMPRHYRSLLANLRCGSLHLAIETGRISNMPLHERVSHRN